MMKASQFVENVQSRQGFYVCCPEEIAYINGWISKESLIEQGKLMEKNQYGQHLLNVENDKIKY